MVSLLPEIALGIPVPPPSHDEVADGNQLVLIDVVQGSIGNLHLHHHSTLTARPSGRTL